jgi:hypothetical protein
MSRYIQKIVLGTGPSQREWWVGWEIDGVNGEIDGLILADALTAEELASKGIREFQPVSRNMLTHIDRRKVLRIRLSEPIHGRIGAIPVKILDLSTGGAGVEHPRPLTPGKNVILEFAHLDKRYSMVFEVLRCAAKRSEMAGGGLAYYSALKFADDKDDSHEDLRLLVSHHVETMVADLKKLRHRMSSESVQAVM